MFQMIKQLKRFWAWCRKHPHLVCFALSWICIFSYINEFQRVFVYPVRGKPSQGIMLLACVIFLVINLFGYLLLISQRVGKVRK